jgi:hypothetical protein
MLIPKKTLEMLKYMENNYSSLLLNQSLLNLKPKRIKNYLSQALNICNQTVEFLRVF